MTDRTTFSGRLLRGRTEEWREGVTMAIYVNLSLLAVLLVIPDEEEQTNIELTLTVLATAIGLLVAHHVAFRLSSRLMHAGEVRHDTKRLMLAQTLGGATAAGIAAVPVLIMGENGLWVSDLLLLVFVCIIGFVASRSGGASVPRALGYVALLVLIVLGVVILKLATMH
ncbi:MAG: hypothetical protein PHU75_10545 [Candidatus Nanopelagicales bacterium]|nr:hypothetical protein [Candidatus Nanopelagicales bacterium]